MKTAPPSSFYGTRAVVSAITAAAGAGGKRGYSFAKELYDNAKSLRIPQRFNFGNSYTETKTKKKKKKPMQDELRSAQNSYVNIVMGRKVPKKVNRGTSLKFLEGRTTTAYTQAGQQSPQDLFFYGTYNQFIGGTSTPNAPAVFEATNPYFSLDINRTTTGSDWAAANAEPLGDNIFWKTLQMEIDVGSFSACPIYLDLYILTPKKDLESGEGPAETFVASLANAGQGITNEADAAAGAVSAAPGAITATHVGVKPNSTKLFNQNYRILKVKKVTLAAGAQERVNISVKMNKVCKQDAMDASCRYIKGQTICVMSVIRGGLVFDKTTAQVATFGNVEAGVVCNAKLHFHPINGTAARINTAFGQRLYPVGATNANQKFLANDDTGKALPDV